MNAPRTRRLTLVPLTALAVALPAVPALAASEYEVDCGPSTITSATSPTNGALSHTRPGTSVGVTPATGVLAAATSIAWAPGTPNYCDVEASYDDSVAVSAGTSGLGPDAPVVLRATIRLRGSVATTGSASDHAAHADIPKATFSVSDPTATEGGELLSFSASANALDTRAGADYDYAEMGWTLSSADGGYQQSPFNPRYDENQVSFDTLTTTMDFPAAVGDALALQHELSLFVDALDGTSSATSRVDEFSVSLSPVTAGIVLAAAPAPDPEPGPAKTAIVVVQETRQTLASYAIHKGTANALGTKLAHAERDLAAGGDACDDLSAFVNQTSAQSGKKLTTAQAGALTALAGEASSLAAC